MFTLSAACIIAGILGARHQFFLAIPCLILAVALHLESSKKAELTSGRGTHINL